MHDFRAVTLCEINKALNRTGWHLARNVQSEYFDGQRHVNFLAFARGYFTISEKVMIDLSCCNGQSKGTLREETVTIMEGG